MGASRSKNEKPVKSTAVDLSTLSARVDRVHISGLQRTWDDYVRRAVQNLFTAKTFEDVLQQSVQTKDNLTELGIFKSINVTIDVSKSKTSTANGYEVTFNGVELSRITGSVGTEIGQNEGAATVELSVPNIWGRGERLSVHGSYGNAKTTDMNIKCTKPFYHTMLGDYKPETSLTVFRTSGQHPWSKFSTNDTGILFDCSFLLPTFIHHSVQYECAIREIAAIGKRVPFFVREECGPKMSSLFRYIGAYDQRDNTVLPTTGFYTKITAEMCGFGGNIAYNRLMTHAEYNVPLFGGISLQFCGRYGLIHADKKLSPNVPISQRFVIGGPFTLRGFQTGGACTHIDGAAVGNHSFWIGGAHLWTPLPFNRHFGALGNNLKLHAFASAGNVDEFTTDNCRTTIGAGLAFRLGERARIELNYCKPLQRQFGDVANKEGFQFGIGFEFA